MSRASPLPWQDGIWARLQEAISSGRLGHAWLLAGPAGVGKRQFARRLAESLLCESPAIGGDACGACRGCVQVQADSHPNLSWLVREISEKTKKEKRDISVDQLREMMERLALSSHYGGTRVVVIEPADALNASGMNAVLKTIEEPPPGTVILLISERPLALAATLRSRCRRLNFPVPPLDAARTWLQQQDLGAQSADALLRESGGAPLAALAAHRSGLAEQRQKWWNTLLALADQRTDPLAAAAEVGKEGAVEWLPAYQGLLHRLLRAVLGLEHDPRLQKLAARTRPAAIEGLLAEATEARRRLLGNASAQLLVESLMIGWWRRLVAGEVRTPTRP
jgi:DNA polymerase-3 subunit delta'